MAVTNQAFVAMFPEFSADVYTSAMISGWLLVAQNFVDYDKWGTLADTGVMLALAHFLVLAANNQAAGTPGGATGLVNSMNAGPVSVGFDTQNTAIKNGGNWNLTTHGQQYLQMARMSATGCRYDDADTDQKQTRRHLSEAEGP